MHVAVKKVKTLSVAVFCTYIPTENIINIIKTDIKEKKMHTFNNNKLQQYKENSTSKAKRWLYSHPLFFFLFTRNSVKENKSKKGQDKDFQEVQKKT